LFSKNKRITIGRAVILLIGMKYVSNQSCHEYDWASLETANHLYISAKEPYLPANELCISAEEPYTSANELCVSAKEPFLSTNVLYICAKESYISAK